MTLRPSSLSILLSLVMLPACTDGGGNGKVAAVPNGSTTSSEGPSSDLKRLIQATCQAEVRCDGSAAGYGDVATCEAIETSFFCGSAAHAFALPGIDACLQAVQSASCDTRDELPAACAGLREIWSAGYDFAALGDACTRGLSQRCDDGAYCEFADAFAECGECVALKDVGAACGDPDECKPDAFCNDGVCTKLLVAGEACLNGIGCDDDSVCHNDVCVATADLLGMPCSDYCRIGSCQDGVCVAPKRPGESCDDAIECMAGLICESGTCKTVSACGEGKLGSPCWGWVHCAGTLACDPETHQCVEAAKDGEACGEPGQVCVRNSRCVEVPSQNPGDEDASVSLERVMVCQPLLPDGSPCNDLFECASSSCNSEGKCGAETQCKGPA